MSDDTPLFTSAALGGGGGCVEMDLFVGGVHFKSLKKSGSELSWSSNAFSKHAGHQSRRHIENGRIHMRRPTHPPIKLLEDGNAIVVKTGWMSDPLHTRELKLLLVALISQPLLTRRLGTLSVARSTLWSASVDAVGRGHASRKAYEQLSRSGWENGASAHRTRALEGLLLSSVQHSTVIWGAAQLPEGCDVQSSRMS
ncbi:MAG: hypothetical protein SGPRY_005019 [Prymnesium sp.]